MRAGGSFGDGHRLVTVTPREHRCRWTHRRRAAISEVLSSNYCAQAAGPGLAGSCSHRPCIWRRQYEAARAIRLCLMQENNNHREAFVKRLLIVTQVGEGAARHVCCALGPSSLQRNECPAQAPSAWCWRAGCARAGGGTRTGPVVLQGSREVKFGTQALREDSGFACSPAQSRLSVYQGDSGLL